MQGPCPLFGSFLCRIGSTLDSLVRADIGFETKTTLGINKLLVSFGFRNSLAADTEMVRISDT